MKASSVLQKLFTLRKVSKLQSSYRERLRSCLQLAGLWHAFTICQPVLTGYLIKKPQLAVVEAFAFML